MTWAAVATPHTPLVFDRAIRKPVPRPIGVVIRTTWGVTISTASCHCMGAFLGGVARRKLADTLPGQRPGHRDAIPRVGPELDDESLTVDAHGSRENDADMCVAERAFQALRDDAGRVVHRVRAEVGVVSALGLRVVRSAHWAILRKRSSITLHELRGEMTGAIVDQQRDRIGAERWIRMRSAVGRDVDSRQQTPCSW